MVKYSSTKIEKKQYENKTYCIENKFNVSPKWSSEHTTMQVVIRILRLKISDKILYLLEFCIFLPITTDATGLVFTIIVY